MSGIATLQTKKGIIASHKELKPRSRDLFGLGVGITVTLAALHNFPKDLRCSLLTFGVSGPADEALPFRRGFETLE